MAESFFLNAIANALGTLMVDYLVKPVERRLRYFFRLKKIVEELQEQKKNLTKEQIQVQRAVEEAKRHIETQVIEKNVEQWLADAENDLKDVQSLECRIEENKRCFRWCPNWSWRYQLSKKIEKETIAIKKLVERSKFDRVGHRATLPRIESLESKDLIDSKSSISAFNQIMEALKREEVNMIGVWGMGGVGKTTLVTKVGRYVEDNQLFNRVIKVVVSQAPILENIQKKLLAEFFEDSDNFEKMTEKRKAAELRAKLEKEEKVLIILDDMWKELNLKKIGIPLDGNSKGCKIILTTRCKNVCDDMAIGDPVLLGTLDEDEAWTLFKKKARLDSASPYQDIIGVAKEVAKECGGLPVAIVTLASALRSRDLNGWELARNKLQRCRLMDIERVPQEVDRNAYRCLEMSYRYLEKEPTKICFLLCALYPEDYSIDVEDLVRHAWALRLYRDADSIKEVMSEVFEAIGILKDSCLLSEVDDEKRHVKVHDVVRDVARWIASKENNGLLTKAGVDSENGSSKQKLEILLLEYGHDSKTPVEDFEGMPELKVLSLRRKRVWDDDSVFSFNAIKSLKNLRSLHLEGFNQLEGISALAKLTNLEILCLHGSEFQESIDSLGELKNLKVLDIRRCEFLLGFPPNLIRRLVEVEELYLLPAEGPSIKTSVFEVATAVILSELKFLPKLASLFLDVRSLHFPKDFVFPKLERYNILINFGAHEKDPKYFSTRLLKIAEGLLLNVISELLQNVEFLVVSSIMEMEIKCLTDTTPGDVPVAAILHNLKSVVIGNCTNLQVIFSMKNAENHPLLLSKLKDLRLWRLPNLECIWKMPTQHISLRSLEAVEIHRCGKLKSLFSFSLARSLECLEKLKIDRCYQLEQIVEQSEGDEQEMSSNMSPDKSLCFPKLRNLEIDSCGSLEYIFPNFMMHHGLPRLQNLQIKCLPRLRRTFRSANQREENEIRQHQLQLFPSLTELELWAIPVRKLHEGLFVNTKTLHLREIRDHNLINLIPEIDREGLNELTSLDLCFCDSLEYLVDTTEEHVPNSAFSNLENLSLSGMDSLKMLCNGQFPKGFLQNLKNLRFQSCGQLQEVFQIDEETQAQLQQLSNLEDLVLDKLPELRWILKGPAHYISLRSLKFVNMWCCKKLKSVFSLSLIQSLQQLEVLRINSCDELRTLFIELESDGEIESNSHLHPLCLPKLTNLIISGCPRLEYVLPITLAEGLPQLEQLKIHGHGCDEMPLKQVFGVANQHDGVEHGINLPRLKHLQLYKLTNLSSFGPENYFLKAPALEEVSVSACPQLMKFTIQQEVNSGVRLQEVRLSAFKEFLRNANDLSLTRIMDFQENLIPDVDVVVDLQGLTSLSFYGCEDLANQEPLLSNLHSLCIVSLPELRWIVKGPTQHVSLRSLRNVSIWECNKLESLFSSSLIPSLRLLESLNVNDCDELKTVFTEDETESDTLCMPNLESLWITNCPTLKYVFAIACALDLPRLEDLKLHELANLSSVTDCPEYCFIKAPALNNLKVYGCPRLSNFTIQQHKPLQSKDFEECTDEVELYNNRLRERSPNMMSFDQLFLPSTGDNFMSNLREVELSDLVWLRYIWKAPTQVVVTNLGQLRVYNCNKLKYVFPAMLIRHLPKLFGLSICGCEKLEQIIVNDDTSASSSQGHDEDETGAKNEEEMLIFRRLDYLFLGELPSLLRFSPVGYHLIFPSLESLEIRGCSQLITSFTADSIQSVHAEAPRLDDATPSKRKIRWTRNKGFEDEDEDEEDEDEDEYQDEDEI